MERLARIGEEMKTYDENMLVSHLLFMSDRVESIWAARAAAISEGKVYIGGGRK